MAGRDVRRHGARDDVARLELGTALPRHEALAGLVDQHRALAAHGLADQRHGIEPDIERGRMELHELHVGQRRAGPRRQRQALADGAQRVGGVRRRARPARRSPARRDGSAAGRRSDGPAASTPAMPRSSTSRRRASSPSITVIEGVALHRRDQRAHDRRPGAVARDMDDAAAGVRGLQSEREAARRRRGRRRRRSAAARRWRPAPPRRCGAATAGSLRPSPARQRVGGMQRRLVVLAHGGGDAALRPGRGGALRRAAPWRAGSRAAAPAAAPSSVRQGRRR